MWYRCEQLVFDAHHNYLSYHTSISTGIASRRRVANLRCRWFADRVTRSDASKRVSNSYKYATADDLLTMSRLLVAPRRLLLAPTRRTALGALSARGLARGPLQRRLTGTDAYRVAPKRPKLFAPRTGDQVAMSSSATNVGRVDVAESAVPNKLEPGLWVTYDGTRPPPRRRPSQFWT